jgi:hypothetical protein
MRAASPIPGSEARRVAHARRALRAQENRRQLRKAGGNSIYLTIVPFAPRGQKVVSAITSGDVPDLEMAMTASGS